MKTNKDFIFREISEEKILIATGEASQKFNGMITLNDVAEFIWKNIDDCESEDILIERILKMWNISLLYR